MTLTSEEIDAIIFYRRQKSYATLQEANDAMKDAHWNLTIQRLYYAVYYVVIAVHLKNGDFAKTHHGACNLFNKRYVLTGALSKEEGMLYNRLFSMRHQGDYDDCFSWNEDDIIPLIEPVEKLINKIITFLK